MGFMANVADVQKIAEALEKVKDLLQSLDSQRSVVVEVRNLTNSPLRLESDHHSEGGFAEPPDPEIPAGHVNVFGSKNSGLTPGVDGRVIYESSEGFLLHVEWENPFIGSNSSNCRVVGENAGRFEARDITGAGQTGAHMQYIVRPGITPGLIVRKFEGEAGAVSEITAIRSRNRELITAVRTGSDTLRLISWVVDSDNSVIRRNGDSENLAGKASNIDLARGRLFVSACRSAEENLVLISWEIEAVDEGGTVRRIFHRRGDSRNQGGDQAREADLIKIVALSDDLFLTAVRSSSNDLKLISWRLEGNNELTRLGDSGEQAGTVRKFR